MEGLGSLPLQVHRACKIRPTSWFGPSQPKSRQANPASEVDNRMRFRFLALFSRAEYRSAAPGGGRTRQTVHIGKIRIENVKRFGEGVASVDLDFTFAGQRTNLAGWTVLAGPNGSGKTTFLQAIALALVTPYAHEEPSNNL